MQDLQLMGVHEDGEHLLLSGADDARFRIPVDEALRAAILRDRPHLGHQGVEVEGELRPRDVQALIRAGASADEAAHRAGWSVEKVHRYEGPILAEREHVAGLARTARLRTRGGSSGSALPTLSGTQSTGTQSTSTQSTSTLSMTLSARVAERLKERGVEVTDASWDSWRAEAGPWTVVLTFAAGGRQRQASWNFDVANRTVSAIDDEARWLSEDVQSGQGPNPAPRSAVAAASATRVYDVEAEGGLRPTAKGEPGQVEPSHIAPGHLAPGHVEHGYVEHPDDPLDLMTAMRERSTARGRRKPGGRRGSSKAGSGKITNSTTSNAGSSAGSDQAPEQTLPLEPDPAPALIELAEEVSAPEPVAPEEPPARRGGRRAGRPSVPKWDEIMFGARPGADRSTS